MLCILSYPFYPASPESFHGLLCSMSDLGNQAEFVGEGSEHRDEEFMAL